MGFDNECIVNIQSLAGEYFCPVCRLLVYPNEALQSQCTHLYCKPCLIYTVSTTRACPYDGYLVTEADSKPLTESNKTLAETIGKIAVHCLYHRSGCTWRGTLSECTSHCSECAFGNSPVVCNRCGIQIVHHQLQEHARICPGGQAQVQQAAATQDPSSSSAAASTDQNQTATALTSQTVVAITTPGHVLNQLANPASQTQPLVQTVAQPTAEQWYQQQQYEQYYQQYPRQDPYQQQYQHYYPYQQSVPQYQQANGQPQPQAQHQSRPQPQPQGQSQPLSHIQAPAALQSQSQMQVNQQKQQNQPAIQPYSQIQSLSHPPGHDQALPQPRTYPYPQVQPHSVQPQLQQHMQMSPYQQPHPQMQHSHPQVQQPVHKYPVPQPQVHPQLQPHASVQHLSQSQVHSHQPNQPLTSNIQSQVQNTSSHAVTGHHSYPQPQPHQNMQLGAPQHTMHMHPQTGPQPQSHHPVQLQNQFPQQTPMMIPHQSHAMLQSQQHPALLPSSVQGQSTPPVQQQPVYAPNQQPGQINQGPVLHPVQQILPQQPFAQHQMLPAPSHLRPQSPAHSFPKNTLAYPELQGNFAPSDSTQHSQSQNAVGRPLIPNHAVQVQPFAQSSTSNTIPVRPVHTDPPGNQNFLVGTNNQVPLSSQLQSRAPEPIGRQGDIIEQQTDSVSGKLGKSFEDLDTVSGSATEMKSVKVEMDMKQIEVWNKRNGEDPHSVQTLGSNDNAIENGDSMNKNLSKGEAAESTWQPLSGNRLGGTIYGIQNDSINEHSVVKGKEIQDEPLLKNSLTLGKETKYSESKTDKLRKDDTYSPKPPIGADNASAAVSQPRGSQGPGGDEYRVKPSEGFAQLSYPAPFSDQGKHQQMMINYGAAAVQQRPSAMSASQLPHPAVPNESLSARQSFQPQSLGPPASYNQVHEPPFHAGASNFSHIEGPQFHAPSPGDMHGGMTANLLPHAPEGRRRQQHPTNLMAAETYPHQRPRYLNGPQCFGLQNERFKSFQVPGQQNIDRREFEDDLKKFPRLHLDAEPISKFGSYSLGSHDSCGSGAKLNPGTSSAASRLLPLPHPPNEAEERQVGFHDDAIKKSGSTLHPGYRGLGPGYGRNHVDGMTPRSPVGEYAEMSWRFGALFGGLVTKSGIDDFGGRDEHHFGDSVGIEFHDSQFPHLPSHLCRDEYEGPGNLRMCERSQSGDFVGHDGYAGHFRMGEHLDPHNFPRHLKLGEPLEFGAHPGHMRAVEFSGARSFESFSKGNTPGHLRVGEPGFRSSFSLPGFPNDTGFLTGDIRSFDNLRRRMAASMGWCRICKVDCKTVEGLDLHSQTRGHQRVAMDMVKSIKQNVKRKKLMSSGQFSVEDGNKSRKTGFEGCGNKHKH